MNYLERFQADIVSVVESSDFTRYVMTSWRFERPSRFRTMPLSGQTPNLARMTPRVGKSSRADRNCAFFQANFKARPA